jgi:hypothetical protein
MQVLARRTRHPPEAGTIPLNLRSFVDGEARIAERTMAGRGSWRTRTGWRDCVCGDDGLGDRGGASGRTAARQQTHAARGRDRDAGRRRGEGRSRHSGADHSVWRHAHPGHGGVRQLRRPGQYGPGSTSWSTQWGLKPATSYTVTAVARNSKGAGDDRGHAFHHQERGSRPAGQQHYSRLR